MPPKRKAKTTTKAASKSNKTNNKSAPKSTTQSKKRKTNDTSADNSSNNNSSTSQLNEFDAVLGEAQDLLGAAAEAQSLGRLKMANAYMILLHARLVGLGKRFDRSILSSFPDPKNNNNNNNNASSSSNEKSKISSSQDENPSNPQQPSSSTDGEPPSEELSLQLAKIIPQGIELDTTMMEHLARAAMELHHKRSNKPLRNNQQQRQTTSPPPPSTTTTTTTAQISPPPPPTTTTKPSERIAWSRDEHARCIAAANEFGIDDTEEIAKAVGTRSETQVRAHLKNVSEKTKLDGSGDGDCVGGGGEVSKKGRGKKMPSRAVNTNAYQHFDARKMIGQGGGFK